MSEPLKLTMQQLAQMALGTPTLTDDNIHILHSLIDLLLKKLNCTEETVSLGGFESKCLEELLQQSQAAPIPFGDQDVQLIEKHLERIVQLEERINSVSSKLENHYGQIRINAGAFDDDFEPPKWERYASYCEGLCVGGEPENEIACNLLRSPDFMRKLQQITRPMIETIIANERKLEILYDKFMKFLKYSEEQYQKAMMVGRAIHETEQLREELKESNRKFEESIEEIIAMLACKLDKQFLPIARRTLNKRFDEVEALINTYEKQVEVARLKEHLKVKFHNDQCLSCGRNKKEDSKICDNRMITQNEIAADLKAKKKTIAAKKLFCGCDGYACMSRNKFESQRLKSDYTLALSHSKQRLEKSHHRTLASAHSKQLLEMSQQQAITPTQSKMDLRQRSDHTLASAYSKHRLDITHHVSKRNILMESVMQSLHNLSTLN